MSREKMVTHVMATLGQQEAITSPYSWLSGKDPDELYRQLGHELGEDSHDMPHFMPERLGHLLLGKA